MYAHVIIRCRSMTSVCTRTPATYVGNKLMWTFSEQAIEAKGGDFLEAPVSGSKQPAEAGTLIILAAGSEVYNPSSACRWLPAQLHQFSH